jgi:hypothetical protein
MSITISVSEKTEQKIRRQAARTGQDVGSVVANLVEDVWDERFPEIQSNGDIDPKSDSEEYENPFKPFIGMFSSGKTDTSERMSEILYAEDLDPAQGFGTDK